MVDFPLTTNGRGLENRFPPEKTVVHFRLDDGARTIDFAPWYGLNIDEVVLGCQIQIQRFLANQDGDYTPQTVYSSATQLRRFFEFCHFVAGGLNRSLRLENIDRELMAGFYLALAAAGLTRSSQKTIGDGVVRVLAALGRRKLIEVVSEGDDATFPQHHFVGLWGTPAGEAPLRRAEREAFTAALKTAITPLFAEDATLTWKLAAYALLVVALYTGRNTGPLLQMPLDCFREHPRKDLTFLVLYKRRGRRWQRAPLLSSDIQI